MTAATSKLDKLSKKSSENGGTNVNRLRCLLVKKGLDEIIEDLDSWQKMFDPSWFLILKASHPFIDKQLNGNDPGTSVSNLRKVRHVLKEVPLQKVSDFLPNDGLDYETQRNIPYTSAHYMRRIRSEKWVIVDPMFTDAETDQRLVTKDVRDLATRLSCAEASTFAILQCRDAIRQMIDNSNKPL